MQRAGEAVWRMVMMMLKEVELEGEASERGGGQNAKNVAASARVLLPCVVPPTEPNENIKTLSKKHQIIHPKLIHIIRGSPYHTHKPFLQLPVITYLPFASRALVATPLAPTLVSASPPSPRVRASVALLPFAHVLSVVERARPPARPSRVAVDAADDDEHDAAPSAHAATKNRSMCARFRKIRNQTRPKGKK